MQLLALIWATLLAAAPHPAPPVAAAVPVTTTTTAPAPVPRHQVLAVGQSPAWPTLCGVNTWYENEAAGSHGEGWINIPCGIGQPGYCWAPPVMTWPGQSVQTGLDYSREVCS